MSFLKIVCIILPLLAGKISHNHLGDETERRVLLDQEKEVWKES